MRLLLALGPFISMSLFIALLWLIVTYHEEILSLF